MIACAPPRSRRTLKELMTAEDTEMEALDALSAAVEKLKQAASIRKSALVRELQESGQTATQQNSA